MLGKVRCEKKVRGVVKSDIWENRQEKCKKKLEVWEKERCEKIYELWEVWES